MGMGMGMGRGIGLDDMLGFGERKWEDIGYGMDHLDTKEALL